MSVVPAVRLVPGSPPPGVRVVRVLARVALLAGGALAGYLACVMLDGPALADDRADRGGRGVGVIRDVATEKLSQTPPIAHRLLDPARPADRGPGPAPGGRDRAPRQASPAGGSAFRSAPAARDRSTGAAKPVGGARSAVPAPPAVPRSALVAPEVASVPPGMAGTVPAVVGVVPTVVNTVPDVVDAVPGVVDAVPEVVGQVLDLVGGSPPGGVLRPPWGWGLPDPSATSAVPGLTSRMPVTGAVPASPEPPGPPVSSALLPRGASTVVGDPRGGAVGPAVEGADPRRPGTPTAPTDTAPSGQQAGTMLASSTQSATLPGTGWQGGTGSQLATPPMGVVRAGRRPGVPALPG